MCCEVSDLCSVLRAPCSLLCFALLLYPQCLAFGALDSLFSALCSLLCGFCSVLRAACSLLSVFCFVLCVLRSVLRNLCSVICAFRSVVCSHVLYTLWYMLFVLRAPCSVLCVVLSALSSPWTLCRLLSALCSGLSGLCCVLCVLCSLLCGFWLMVRAPCSLLSLCSYIVHLLNRKQTLYGVHINWFESMVTQYIEFMVRFRVWSYTNLTQTQLKLYEKCLGSACEN